MNGLQRNGGTLGILAGISLAVFFILFATSGLRPEILADPARGVPAMRDLAARLRLIGMFGVLAVAFSLPFTVALYRRLRDGAPTRATTALVLLVVGLAGHGLGSTLAMTAFPIVVRTPDPTAAAHAYTAVYAISQSTDVLGNAFTGAGTALAGWAILAARALSAPVGWVGVAAGILSLLAGLGFQNPVVFLGGLVLTIVFLIWAGVALRGAGPLPGMRA